MLSIKKSKTALHSTIVRAPQLRLDAEVAPKTHIAGGDRVTLSAKISHTEKSFADAVDTELSIVCPLYLEFDNYSCSLSPQNVTNNRHDLVLKFSSITQSTRVTVAITTNVDSFHLMTSPKKVAATCLVTLWYYGARDSCGRPGNKWNARSTSQGVRFSFTTKEGCERQINLQESYFSASSFDKTTYNSLGNSPHHANFAHNLIWTPADTEDNHQYLQVQFNKLMRITKVGTKGNGQLGNPRYVRKFRLYHSQDGRDWAMAFAAFQSYEFEGNSDSTTVKINTLKVPVEARFIRIAPKSWKDKTALKVEFFGCSVHQIPAGYQPLGMFSGSIQNNKITVLSGNSQTYKPFHARLDFNTHTGGWCTPRNSKQTLVVDLEDDYVIAEIAVQSKYQNTDGLIKQFKIAYKKNGGQKTYIKQNTDDKTFLGNPIEDTTIRHKFLDAILSRHVYIEPKQLSNTGCLRLELYGHKESDEYISEYCTIFDFEGDLSLQQWNSTGTAFDNQPTLLDNLLARTGQAVNHEGTQWVGTRENRRRRSDIPGSTQGNDPIGTLTSPEFLITGSKLYFLFAGTADESKSRVELLIEGNVARTSFSKTGNESLVPMSWDVKQLVGRLAQIRIVDSGSDTFVSFDGLKSNCHLREELLPVFERSFLLNRMSNTLYLCHFSHLSNRNDPICRLTFDNGVTWQDLSHVAGLLGINEVTGELYGVSVDRRDRLVNANWIGRGSWREVKASEWNEVKGNLNKVVEIPNIPATGLSETDQPLSVLTLTANSGDKFTASSLGVYHQSSGGSWSIIATWLCKGKPDSCASNPCNNEGTCRVTSDGGYNCTCPSGFSGDICDDDSGICNEDSCLNGGQCVVASNTFYCVCNSFYTGERCERNIDDCSSSPCSPGSVCIDGLGSFTCQCPPGFVGEFCQMETDECASMPCQHDGQCVDHVNSYTCHCRNGYSGINCENVRASAFEVLSTASVVHESSRYTVVHANIPQDGRSRHQTWCHDYTELCYSLNKTRPTGCGRSSNHITEMHQCQTVYDSVMPHNYTLSCPPNEKVSLIARLAGFSNATSTNSFAFSKCSPSECTATLPNSGCHEALYCINQGNAEVYTLCTDPESNFMVEDKGYTKYKGVDYLALYVKPLNSRSRQENWCRDYQRLCESYGKRPTGCGETYSGNTSYSACRDEYVSIMPGNNDLGCTNNTNLISNISQQAGMPSTTRHINFHICSQDSCNKNLSVFAALKSLESSQYVYHVLCTEPLTGFTVLEERWTTYDNINFLVVKARLPRNRKSIHEDWCRDYAKLCESYGLRPTGHDIIQDHDYTSCRDRYGSVMIDKVFFGSTPQSKIASIAQQAGCASANTNNSFGLDKCTHCPSILTSSNCKGLGCIKPSRHDDVYTVCIKPQSKFDVLESKTATHNNKPYLVMKAKVAGKDLSNWAEEHNKICSRYGRRNVVCKSVKTIASTNGPSQSNAPETTFAPTSANTTKKLGNGRTLPSRSSVQSTSSQTVNTSRVSPTPISFAPTSANTTKKLGNGRTLPSRSSVQSTSSQTVNASQVLPTPIPFKYPVGQTEDKIACNQTEVLRAVVVYAGFGNATTSNIYIPDSFEDSNTPSADVVYLLCEGPDANFNVISTKPTVVRGQEYLIIEATLPASGLARHENWCEDYKQLCLSYGHRPFGCGTESSGAHTACRDTYDAILPKDNSMGCPSNLGIVRLANLSGYPNANAGNSFAFSICNESSCSKEYSRTAALYAHKTTPSIGPNQLVYTLCVGSNTSFNVESSTNVSYQGGTYKIIQARIPSHHTSKQQSWCHDYQSLCNSYGWRPVMTSRDADFSCERSYGAISPIRDEVSSNEKLEYLVETAGYDNANVGNIFAFRKKCKNSCFSSISGFSGATEPAIHLSSKSISQNNNITFVVCINSDTNFHVLDSSRISHQDRLYLVLKTRLPSHGVSKFDNWCTDYQRLCGEHEMRPVSVLSSGSRGSHVGICTPDYRSIVISKNETLNLFTREQISIMANLAGFKQASRESSFAFSECNPQSCPRFLDSKCASGLDCLRNEPSELYTVCTNSNSSFIAKETLNIQHKGIPYLMVRSNIPEHGVSMHKNWCLDYMNLCNSFGMQPVVCVSNPPVSDCSADFANTTNSCELKDVRVLNKLVDDSFSKNASLFMPAGCDKCSETIWEPCPHHPNYKNESVLTVCTALQSNIKVLETRPTEHENVRLSVVKAKVMSNGSSFHQNWGYDYNRMCLSLGKRPFSCGEPGNNVQYKNRETYDLFLSENSCDVIKLKSLAVQAGYSQVKNVLLFKSSQVPTNKLVFHHVSGTFTELETLVSLFQKNTSFAQRWKRCVEQRLPQGENHTVTEICSVGRVCFNDTQLANNSCDVIFNCHRNNCAEYYQFEPTYQMHMSACPPGENCSRFNSSEDVYAFCSDFSPSNFVVKDVREVMYADQPYTVVKGQVPSHGQSQSENWCEDYKMLCQAIGKRPLGCGRSFEMLKQSRDCRMRYDAIMMEGMSCPGSQEVATIARHAGFPANVNESLGLWNCEKCSKNFSESWNKVYSPSGTNITKYITNTAFNVYLVCTESNSNFKVLEKRVVKHRGSLVSVVMTTIPHHGESRNENWCIDYSKLCQSYGLRPVGCGKSAETIEEHARCRDGYNALMYSDDTVDCSEKFNVHEIARSAGFTTATPQNSFIFESCLAQDCTRFLPSREQPFTQFLVNSTDRVYYTLCASSDSAYDVIATKQVTIAKQDYLVIRAMIPVDGRSKHQTWCEDYKRLCEGYAMKPLTCEHGDLSQRMCIYYYGSMTKTNDDLACPAKTGVAAIAKQAGFDHVNDTNSFAMESCDTSKSCVAKMPNIQCKDTTHYDSLFETNATEVKLKRADYIVNITVTRINTLNETETIIVPEPRHCFVIPDPPSGEPHYAIDGEKLTDIFKSNTCKQNFVLNAPGVILTNFSVTANQTFEHKIPRVETNCGFLSSNSLSRMSGEANTVCLRPESGTNFRVQSVRTVSSSGRDYLIIQTKLLSALSKSSSWCTEYANLCKAFYSSPLACPRRFGFDTNYGKCVSNYGAIMMSDVDYECPSNSFVSQLARMAGYKRASLANSFSLNNCNDDKCLSKLPLTGCSDAVHCLSEEILHDHVYTACVVANSDSNFNVIEKREKVLRGFDHMIIRSRIPEHGTPLFETWCEDYLRLCQSFNLRPIHCTVGLSADDYGVCKQKYSSVLTYNYSCPIQAQRMGWHAGYSECDLQNSFAFHKCSMCSKNLHSSNCDKALNCLNTGTQLKEVYTACRGTETQSSFQPLATKQVRHGRLKLRVVQAKVISQSSAVSNWGKDYKNLCGFYDELPTGCGVVTGRSSPGVSACESKYNSYVLHGDQLGCNPNDVIAKLARDAGFVNARPSNSFGFSCCNGSSVSQLSSKCLESLPCLTWNPDNPIVYTVCVNNVKQSNFEVLDVKSITFNYLDYLVIHARLPENGKSYKTNWCKDYEDLCVSFNMLPTGCGGDNVKFTNYSSCSTEYSSYMPADDILECGDTKIVSAIAKKAGFKDAIPENSFVFHNCHQCTSDLTRECDGALNCVNNIIWQRQVYTACVNPKTGFNVRSTSSTVFGDAKYLVLEARLPADGRAKSATWCQEYENLCQSYNAQTVACHKEDNYMECAKYTAKESSFSCDGKDVSNIALQAGYSDAKQENTFIFNNCNSCSKTLASSGCDNSLSCINSNPTEYVYVVCLKESSTFKIVDSRKVSTAGAVYTAVSALLPERTSSTWCKDYAELCHAIGQSPVALHSGVVTKQLLKCRDDYDAVIQMSEIDVVHQIAAQAGYSEAKYGNTFAFKGCSYDSCESSPYSYNCSGSLHCLDGVTPKVFGLCIETTSASNFYVLDSKTVHSNDTTYTVLKVRIPTNRLSKFESWCRDYERLCHAHNLRPLTRVASRECSVEYFSTYNSKFTAASLVKVAHLAGYPNATTGNLYSFQECGAQECGRHFQIPHCVSCRKSDSHRRVFYAVCASLDENLQTNFITQDVRDVWFDASFLIGQVKIPSHRQSKTENWCYEYQTFCKSYDRQPYTSRNVSTKLTTDACSWKYNTTSYDTGISPGAIVERAGFNSVAPACISSLHDCTYCAKTLDEEKCPFKDCQAAVGTCDDFYIVCI